MDILIACPDVAQSVQRLESRGPMVPPPLRALWEQVGEVTFVDLDHYSHVQFWTDVGIRFVDRSTRLDPLPQFCDGVRVEAPCSSAWLDFQFDEFETQEKKGDEPALVLSPDGYHKDDISGGAPYELLASALDPWMPIMRSFAWSGPQRPASAPDGPVDLVSYLRTGLLECGGFPGLLGSEEYEPFRISLTDGLPVF